MPQRQDARDCGSRASAEATRRRPGEFSYRLRVSAKRRRSGLDTDYGTAGRLPDTHCGQPPRRKRRVADIDMSKKVLNQPGIHALICLADPSTPALLPAAA